MRILITGASGLLGVNLALEAAKHHQVFGVVNRHPLQTTAFKIVQADLLEPGAPERVLEETQPDWVIHCAALAFVDQCETKPDLARRLNSELPGKLAQLVARGGARLVHISTDAVFDGQRGGYTEDDHPNPLSTYAKTKLAGEYAVLDANPDAAVARVNLHGWSMTGKRSLAEFFYYSLSQGKQVMGFTDVYFCPLLANHLSGLLMGILQAKLTGLYHVVSSDCLTKYDFGVRIAERFGLDASLITPTSVYDSGLTAVRSPNLTLKVDKLTQDLGVAPPDITAGIDELYRLYQQGYPQKLLEMAQKET